ncbi:fumarylacetoacetase [Micractinium conductrix]|uniref:fumarylacetoacetase n=1 Tax=Micractinium conductrix TaxID=554055 RepID=A0A2P6VNW0_9CHLO|nr:fumarylacetoacetase [Micractinium conductrix]|eukprot:PSC75747.1 fumarylacetoacetase [Micractinium conductrix]
MLAAQQQSLGLGAPPPPPLGLQLHYRTSWQQPVLHHSVNGGEWRGVEMQQVVSGTGWWTAAQLQLDVAVAHSALGSGVSSHASGSGSPAPLLEFVITDGQHAWDKAPDGANYMIADPGRWRLSGGKLAQAATPPVMLVSDLDDTMIGDDASTAEFTRWWREEGVAAGGRLVFNTGRALDLFEALLVEKSSVMAEPDLLISSIGTRVYAKGPGGRWLEDEGYTALLGRGWALEAVREACYRALATVGKEAMHFRPPSEMSEHKVTCGVRINVLEKVLASVSADLAGAAVEHRMVISGSGDWRYMDLVPREAGKLQALEYARRTLGFEPEQTVAAGDSGNDIDMLEGQHRSIVVGNAHGELRAWAEARHAALASGAASGGELLLVEGHRASGILEGLQRFGFKKPGVAIGDSVLDLRAVAESGLFAGPLLSSHTAVFQQPTLNAFMALGRPAWLEARATLQRLLSAEEGRLRDDVRLRERALVSLRDVRMHLPAGIGDYTDFYASREHATNMGRMFRVYANALQPNWLHLPVGYHGRASSIVVSGTDVRRPWGQALPPAPAGEGATGGTAAPGAPVFQPCAALDYELEMGCLIGPGNELGAPIPVDRAADHIFGLVLVNDWSARDLQRWEYVPLGPFTSKSFATSLSPWVVTLEALQPFAVAAPPQEAPCPLPYLRQPPGQRTNFNISLEVALQPAGSGGGGGSGSGGEARAAEATVVTRSNLRTLYWTLPQMIAHHTAGGCNLRPGDLLATGTLSCEGPQGAGCLQEATWNSSRPVRLADGSERCFLQDGDSVVVSGYCQGEGYRVGFGECCGAVLPALPPPA